MLRLLRSALSGADASFPDQVARSIYFVFYSCGKLVGSAAERFVPGVERVLADFSLAAAKTGKSSREGIFSKHRVIDRFLGRRYSRRRSNEALKCSIRLVQSSSSCIMRSYPCCPCREAKERLLNSGIEITVSSPEQFAVTIKPDMAKWGKVIRLADIKRE